MDVDSLPSPEVIDFSDLDMPQGECKNEERSYSG